MTETASRKRRIALVVISLATVVAVYYGWRLFWFLTDDAFIAFRYISNSHLGYGYVWNAPPFRPVEGYTSFLWVVLLDLVWRVSGVEPPAAANYVSLLFTCLTLFVGGLMVLKLNLRDDLGRHRLVLLCLVLVGVITNRTFLTWSSSGLETALFNFLLTTWIYRCVFTKVDRRQWVFWLTLTTALLCLARPDGLLFAAVTVVLVVKASWDILQNEKGLVLKPKKAALLLASWATPLLIIPAHIVWRRAVYGAWLPNTYFAKTFAGRVWPQSGLRYCLSFVMEYSLWIWLLLLLAVIVSRMRRAKMLKDLARFPLNQTMVCMAVLAHFLYYTIAIGGDHFEYRVYSHLVPLIFISFLWLLNAVGLKAKSAVLIFSLFIVLSWPIPWLHWSATHNLNDRETTQVMRVPVADAAQRAFSRTPNFVLSYLRAFDRLQFWLIGHFVCMRHQEHKVFYLHLVDTLPARAEGLSLPDTDYPVLTARSVGVVSWVAPKVNVIDAMGLSDYVVARNPEVASFILMAHERQPPKGYTECFAPNVVLEKTHIIIAKRGEEMTAEKIMRCESEFAAVVDAKK